MAEYTKGKIELFTFNGKLPAIREIKNPHREASCYVAILQTKDRKKICKLDFGYGKKNDAANAAELVKRWNCHEDLVGACEAALGFLGTSSKLDWDNILTPQLEAALAAAKKS